MEVCLIKSTIGVLLISDWKLIFRLLGCVRIDFMVLT
jgi:hypothetical protein